MEFYRTSIMCTGKMEGRSERLIGGMLRNVVRFVLESCNNPLNDLKMQALFMLKRNTFVN